MIIEKKFNCLKNELLKTIFELNKELITNNIYSSLEEYKKFLNGLYFDFVKEVRDNLIHIKDGNENGTYLDSLTNMLSYLNEMSCLGINLPVNENSVPKELILDKDQVLTLMFKMAQKPIVKDALDFVKRLSSRRTKLDRYLSNLKPKPWHDELKEFYPEITRIKGELLAISTIQARIIYLAEERKRLAEYYRKDGVDLYNSAINFFSNPELNV